MIIIFHRDFTKGFKKLSPKLKKRFQDRLEIFEEDGFDPVLNNHALKGKWLGYRSINVTGNMRAIFKRDSESVIFVAIDSHGNLYG